MTRVAEKSRGILAQKYLMYYNTDGLVKKLFYLVSWKMKSFNIEDFQVRGDQILVFYEGVDTHS